MTLKHYEHDWVIFLNRIFTDSTYKGLGGVGQNIDPSW